jgi:tetratricopeptide (TPR) repeat protein
VRKNSKYYLAGSISLITFLVYLGALHNSFAWDDRAYVSGNPHIRSLDVTLLKWAFLDFYSANWHPLTWMSHAVDYALWGLNPLGHHLTNNILHTANTFLTVIFVVRLLEALKARTASNEWPSFLTDRAILIAAGTTGLLFGIHPLHVESVAWVAERKDLLCGLFFLLSILAYVKYAYSVNSQTAPQSQFSRFADRRYLVTLGLFILALLSKPMAVSLPVVLLILDWYPFSRIRSAKTLLAAGIEKLPFIALSFVSSILTVLAQGKAIQSTEFAPLSTRLLVAAQSLIAYLLKMLWPVNLVPYYPYPTSASLASAQYLLPVVLVIGITGVCAATATKQRFWLSAWGYYVVTLIPVIGIVQVGGQAMADRYTYLPSLGPFLVIGSAVAWASIRFSLPGRSRLMAGLFGSILVFVFASLLYLTSRQIGIWQNDLVLWSYVVEKEPNRVPIAYNNRGLALKESGRFDEAIEDFEKTIALDPSRNKAYDNLADVYFKAGLFEKSIAYLDKSIAIDPADAEAYNNRGVVFDRMGRFDRAFADYDRAISLDPSFWNPYINRGLIFYKMGQLERAIADFDYAISLNPAQAEAYYNRGLVFDKMGQLDKARADYDRAIFLNPKDVDAWNTRGLIFYKKGQLDRAIEDFDRAISLAPAYSESYYNRGLAFQKSGQLDKAARDFTAWKAYSATQQRSPEGTAAGQTPEIRSPH